MEWNRDRTTTKIRKSPVAPGDLDFVLLTHAHMDHSGNLPAIVCTRVIRDRSMQQRLPAISVILCFVTVHISRCLRQNGETVRAAGRANRNLYLLIPWKMPWECCRISSDVHMIRLLTPAEGIEVRFVDAGHLLGSSSIEIWLTEDDKKEKIVFSGDIGNLNQPLIKDPVYIKEADYVVMESTYGDRSHGERPDYAAMLAEIIQRTFDRGGNLVIPSFAVGRTQEMLYFIRQIKEMGLVHGHDGLYRICRQSSCQ